MVVVEAEPLEVWEDKIEGQWRKHLALEAHSWHVPRDVRT
jgi:hypothetical protein